MATVIVIAILLFINIITITRSAQVNSQQNGRLQVLFKSAISNVCTSPRCNMYHRVRNSYDSSFFQYPAYLKKMYFLTFLRYYIRTGAFETHCMSAEKK